MWLYIEFGSAKNWLTQTLAEVIETQSKADILIFFSGLYSVDYLWG